MAAYIYPTTNYPSVRAAVGLEVDEVSLPDSTLDLPVHKGEAERFIMRNLTEVQYTHVLYTGEVHHAATLYLASLIVPKIRVVQSERIAGGNLTYAPVNLSQIAKDLQEAAYAAVADIKRNIGGTAVKKSRNVNFFGVAHRDLGLSGAPDSGESL